MKTQEQIFEEVVTPNGGGTLREKVYQAIQLYSDQQNKEKDAEIQRLTTENKELEEKLMSEQIENGYLQAFRVSNEAEIQRLTKDVGELKEDRRYWGREYTRLRELLEYTKEWIRDNASEQATKHGKTAKLLTKIDNELNPKP